VPAACANPPTRTSPTAEAEVRAALAELAHAFTTNDAERVVALASRDMHLIHPTRGEVTYEMYTSGFREAFAQPPPPGQKLVVADLDRVYVSGELAVVGITWRTTLTAPDGAVTRRGERDQEVWRREADGRWRLFRGASYRMTPEQLDAAGR
ncbi:MAG TPA: nuclear transport factor 2 family protein, partial [Polyangiaceae bacterium]|nr:nuclear transport factor 2 family protein [Polyangiaceae bacterium]